MFRYNHSPWHGLLLVAKTLDIGFCTDELARFYGLIGADYFVLASGQAQVLPVAVFAIITVLAVHRSYFSLEFN